MNVLEASISSGTMTSCSDGSNGGSIHDGRSEHRMVEAKT